MYTVLIIIVIIPSERALCKIQAVGVVCAHRHSLKVHTCVSSGYVDGEFCLPCMHTCLVLPEVFPKLFARCPRPSFQSLVLAVLLAQSSFMCLLGV